MATADAVTILRQTPLVTALHTRIRDQNASRHTVRRPRRPRPHRRPPPAPALQFVTQSDRLVRLLVEEAMGLLPATPKRVETPCGVYDGCALPSEDELCAVSIMRAADCMVSACRSVMPDVPIGKILIQRDETTALPKFSYAKLPPNVANMHVLLLDPMLATGGSATMAIRCLVEAGVPPSNIIFINVVCCQRGLDVLHGAYPQARGSCEHPPSSFGACA